MGGSHWFLLRMRAPDLPSMATGMCLPAVLPTGPLWPLHGLGSHRATLVKLPSSSSLARAMVCLSESSRVTSMLKSCMHKDSCMSPCPHCHRDSCHVSATPVHASLLPPLCKAKGWPERKEPRCKGSELPLLGLANPSVSAPGPGPAKGSCGPRTS